MSEQADRDAEVVTDPPAVDLPAPPQTEDARVNAVLKELEAGQAAGAATLEAQVAAVTSAHQRLHAILSAGRGS